MGRHLVLVGGGHAHMLTLANVHRFVQKGHRITVIGPSEHHYYSGMGPGMLGKTYAPEEIRFQTRRLVEKQGGTFLRDTVTTIDPDKKLLRLKSGAEQSYDLVSFNVGSYVPRELIQTDAAEAPDIYPVKPIENLLAVQKRLLELGTEGRFRVGIVGGGPSTAEISGNIHRLLRDSGRSQPHIQLFAGLRFMARFPRQVRRKVIDSLENRDIEVLEEGYVRAVEPGRLILESGYHYQQDLILLAPGIRPSPIFRASSLPTGPDGGLQVNDFLHSPDYPDIFGGGDCIYFQKRPLDKVGVYAVRQNPVLLHNLLARCEIKDLIPFDPGGDYLLIFNLGDGTGVFRKKNIVFNGRLAFLIKDRLDRRFMKKFQAFE